MLQMEPVYMPATKLSILGFLFSLEAETWWSATDYMGAAIFMYRIDSEEESNLPVRVEDEDRGPKNMRLQPVCE